MIFMILPITIVLIFVLIAVSMQIRFWAEEEEIFHKHAREINLVAEKIARSNAYEIERCKNRILAYKNEKEALK